MISLFKSKIIIFIRSMWVYKLYLFLFNNKIYKSIKNEVIFYSSLHIPSDALVFDVGANIGDKSAMFSKLCKSIVAIEPDVRNHKLLKFRFSLNRKISVVNSAVGGKNHKALFHINTPGSPANTLSKKWKEILEDPKANRWSKSLKFELSYMVEVLTIESLITNYGLPYFIKIDVEGYELQVIKGLNTPIPILSFEANLPEFREETLNCVWELHKISNKTTFNCIDSNHKFFFKENRNLDSIINWLRGTDQKYFEVFCFSV
jgi:FkbM family methyltransferase